MSYQEATSLGEVDKTMAGLPPDFAVHYMSARSRLTLAEMDILRSLSNRVPVLEQASSLKYGSTCLSVSYDESFGPRSAPVLCRVIQYIVLVVGLSSSIDPAAAIFTRSNRQFWPLIGCPGKVHSSPSALLSPNSWHGPLGIISPATVDLLDKYRT